jgi:hypothetical protein
MGTETSGPRTWGRALSTWLFLVAALPGLASCAAEEPGEGGMSSPAASATPNSDGSAGQGQPSSETPRPQPAEPGSASGNGTATGPGSGSASPGSGSEPIPPPEEPPLQPEDVAITGVRFVPIADSKYLCEMRVNIKMTRDAVDIFSDGYLKLRNQGNQTMDLASPPMDFQVEDSPATFTVRLDQFPYGVTGDVGLEVRQGDTILDTFTHNVVQCPGSY